jgi:hypothetical protein
MIGTCISVRESGSRLSGSSPPLTWPDARSRPAHSRMNPRLRPRVIRGLIRGLHAPFLPAWQSRRSAAAARGAASAAQRARLGSAHHARTSAPLSMIGKEPIRLRLIRSGIGPILEAVTISLAVSDSRISRHGPWDSGGERVSAVGEGEREAGYRGLPIPSRTARHEPVRRSSRGARSPRTTSARA